MAENKTISKELAGMLQERNEARENGNDSKIEKSYTPFNVYSFAQLDNVKKVEAFNDQVRELYWQFIAIGENILYDYPNEAPARLIALVTEFNQRLQQLQTQLQSGSVALFKNYDGTMYWVGVPTNKFKDREDDIFSDISHRKLVKSLTNNEWSYPDLHIWHNKPAVGKATWVDYDERGFLVAGGVIHKEYQELVETLVKTSIQNNEPLGMSQGIYTKDLKRDSDGVIIEYKPFEFTFLPHSNACNILTSFTTQGA